MLIDTTLLVNHPELIKGLAEGSIKRFGGVLRDASNGRIVKHLLEAPRTTEALGRVAVGGPSAVIDVIGHGITHHKLNVVQQTLSSVLQVSQVAAGASVLNLGVSVAGFAYMGYKLNQLEKSVTAMQTRMEEGFGNIDAKLQTLNEQLGYITFVVESSALEQQKVRDSLAELHRTILVIELAELQSWLDQLARFPSDDTKEAIRVASKVRRTLSDQATRTAPALDPRAMLVADVAIQGWMAAVATEAQLLMDIGHHTDAKQLIDGEMPRFGTLVKSWSGALLANEREQLNTAYRFAAPRFKDTVLPERVERMARIHERDLQLSSNQARRTSKEAALELEMSHNSSLDDGWTLRQLAIAEYVDGLSELNDRLGGLREFARECEARNLPSSRQALPDASAKAGIYVLDAATDD